MASVVTAAGLAISLPFTYFLVRYVSKPTPAAVLLAVIVPFWTSYLLRVYAWQAIHRREGRPQSGPDGRRPHQGAIDAPRV